MVVSLPGWAPNKLLGHVFSIHCLWVTAPYTYRCETSKLTPLATHIFLECSPPQNWGFHDPIWRVFFKWVFPKIGVSQNGWFIMENPIKMDDLGVPLFSETSKLVETRNHQRKYRNPHLWSGGQRIGRNFGCLANPEKLRSDVGAQDHVFDAWRQSCTNCHLKVLHVVPSWLWGGRPGCLRYRIYRPWN